MNKYYESIVDAKNYLFEYFNEYDNYNNAIDIYDFADQIRERHNKMISIEGKMAFIATIALATFLINDQDGTLMSCNLPATRDVIDFLETDFQKYYKKKNLGFNLINFYDYDDVDYAVGILR